MSIEKAALIKGELICLDCNDAFKHHLNNWL